MASARHHLRNSDTPLKAFSNFIDTPILERIVECTNAQLDSRGSMQKVVMEDVKKFIGACLFIGIMKGKNMPIR